MQSATRKLLTLLSSLTLLAFSAVTITSQAQDNVFTGTNTGADRIRIAVSDFKPGSGDSALKPIFDATLYSDLANAGIFDIV
jgi:TolB protein